LSSFESTRILVVDDNEINRDILKLRLEVKGYRVESVESGPLALEALRTNPFDNTFGVEEGGGFDIVLLDVMMPGMSGLEVLQEIRKTNSVADLPVIMVTAKDSSEDVVEALGLGANDYVTKPIDFAVLFARMNHALQLKHLTTQKDEFLAIASHDLKNPLAVIRGFLKLISLAAAEGEPMTKETLSLLERISKQSLTMERIIIDFLDFQAVEDGMISLDRNPVNLADVATHVIEMLEGYAGEKRMTLIGPTVSDLPNVMGDDTRLEQVVQNIVGNAIKFSKPGTTIRIDAQSTGEMVVLEVRDEGPGIPAGEGAKLFQKYVRLSNRPTGGEKSSGLGLVISRKIVELHGGLIGARNNSDGPGATFWIKIPQAKKP